MPGPEDFFINCGASIARDLVCGAIREARYCCCFNNFTKDLKKEKEELQKHKKRVDDRVDIAIKATKEPKDVDKDWLEEANKLGEQVKGLEAKVEKYKSCCLGRCPNWICRYILGRQLAKKKDNVKLHCDKTPPDGGIERHAPLPGMGYFSSGKFMKFDSRQLAHEQLMEAIKDDGVSMIGLYGMGGCGKTTLAKEVGKEAEERFNYKVVLVAVSSKVEVKKIQGKIASSLEFKLEENEEIERAKRLWMRLRSDDERVLIILDDVWERLDFEAIGIPFGENSKGCKVLMTTRTLRVCNLMFCQKIIHLSILSFDESWTLFQKHAHFTNETHDVLKELGKKITEKCDGLPVAIAAVASTLKGKTQIEWEVALNKLIESKPVDIEAGLQNPYTCLELSYENLKYQGAKSLFLLCSAFPEDMDIPVEFLIRFGVGLGLFEEASSYTMGRKQVIAAKNELINACLLLEAEDGKENSIKMHDLVRDVALYLENKEIEVIKGNGRNENALEEDLRKLKDNQLRYLWCDKFPNQLSCSKLELLSVISDSEIQEVPCGFFESLKMLRVLFLFMGGKIEEKPQLDKSIEMLTNLHCLFLVGFELGHISFLGSMKQLGSLTLVLCTFHQLPEAIEHLTKLRLLHVEGCTIERNPYEVIGRCSQLEEVYFFRSNCSEWGSDEETATKFLEKFGAPEAMKRYNIQIGAREEVRDINDSFMDNILTIEYFDASISNAIIKDLVKRAEALSLGHIKGDCESIVPDMYKKIGGMDELIELVLHNSEEIRYLIDCTKGKNKVEIVFSKLTKLWIKEMHRLEALCHGPPPPGFFEKLKELYICKCSQLHGILFVGKLNLSTLEVLEVKDCPELTSFFTLDCAQSLLQLQNIEISRCNKLEHIITEEVKEDIIEDDNDRRISQLPLQKLQKFLVNDCKKLKYVIPVSYARRLVQLKRMEIEKVDELKFLFGQFNRANGLADSDENDFLIKFPVLECLYLSNLPNIVSIFPENYYPVWPSLCMFYMSNCPQFAIVSLNKSVAGSEVRQHCNPTKDMDPLIIPSNRKSDGISPLQTLLDLEVLKIIESNVTSIFQVASFSISTELALPLAMRLKSLCLGDSHELRYMCKGPMQIMSLQNLVHLEIYGCGKIKSVFSANSFESMPQLEEIRIRDCNQLEQIIANEEYHNTMNSDTDSCRKSTSNCCTLHPGSLNLCKLKWLTIDNCSMLKSLFTLSTARTLTSLEKLNLESCDGLKEIIICKTSCGGKKEESIFQDYVSILFPKLKDIQIEKCNSLECIFPVSFTQGPSELEGIYINNAAQLQYLFGEGSHDQDQLSPQYQNFIPIELPVLKILNLKNLPNLISICPNNYSATYPSLQILKLKCVGLSNPTTSNLKGGSEDKQLDNTSTKDMDPLIIPSNHKSDGILPLQTLLDLESLEIIESNVTSIFQVASFSISTELTLPLAMRLKSLCLSDSHELRYMCKGPMQIMSLQNLVKLEICRCGKIKSVFSANSFESMPQLEEIRIRDCNQLEQIIANEEYHNTINSDTDSCRKSTSNCCTLHPGSLNLCKLKWLTIDNCSMLKSLFTLSTARTLTSLEKLNLWNCDGLKEIIICKTSCGGKKEESIFQDYFSILFPKLKDIQIKECNSLECIFPVSFTQGPSELEGIYINNAAQLQYLFGEGSHDQDQLSPQYQNFIPIELPVLKYLNLKNLPNLISICPNNYSATYPSLQFLKLECVDLFNPTTSNLKGGSEDKQLDNTSTKGLLLISNKVTSSDEMGYLCASPNCFMNLQSIEVSGCGKLKAMFDVSALRSLPQLEELIIRECEELEQITTEDEKNENIPYPYSKKVCFPQLKVLCISSCNKLKRLFSNSTSREFPKLEWLIIKEASQLEQAFESDKCDTKERKEVVLPELKYLFLLQLPSLNNVYQGVEFQTVTCRVVQNCPSLTLATALQKSVEELENEIVGIYLANYRPVYRELVDILHSTTKETINEDPMLDSKVSDSRNEAASRSEPAPAQLIEEKGKGIVEYGSASRTPAIAMSSTDVYESMDEQSINEQTLLGQQLSVGETEQTNKVPREICILYDQSVEAEESARKSPAPEEAAIATFSDDLELPVGSLPKVSAQESMKARSEAIMTNQQDFGEMTFYSHSNASHNVEKPPSLQVFNGFGLNEMKTKIYFGAAQGVIEEVLEDLPIKKDNTMTSLTDLVPNTEVVLKESAREDTNFEEAKGPLVIGPLQKSSHQNLVDGKQEGLTIKKAKTIAASSQVAADGVQKSLVIEKAEVVASSSQNSPNAAPSPFSSTSTILLAELSTRPGVDEFSTSKEFLGSGPILEPGLLKEIKTKLARDFSVPVEAICKVNTLDDVERIVNSLAKGTTDLIQNNMLEDFKNRLKQFNDCVPKAISTMQSSLDLKSNYESLNVEQRTNLSEGHEKHRDLECNLFESCAEENAVDMEIQQLIVRKMEILEQRKSLASQLNQSTEAVSKDYAEWKAMGEKLKLSTEKWLKLKEALARANASWRLFKESIGL